MTVLGQDLRTFLYASTDVNQHTGTRIHYVQIPQVSALPHLWYRVTSDTEERTMDGVGGLHEAYADIECAAATPSGAQDLADAVKTRLDGYAGTLSDLSAKAIFLRDKDDDYIPYSNQSDDGVHVIAFTATIWYST